MLIKQSKLVTCDIAHEKLLDADRTGCLDVRDLPKTEANVICLAYSCCPAVAFIAVGGPVGDVSWISSCEKEEVQHSLPYDGIIGLWSGRGRDGRLKVELDENEERS